MIEKETEGKGDKRRIFGLSTNVIWMGVVSFLNDLSSDMIFPFIPIFLTSVLGASLTFVGLVEGIADSTASILKIASGWFSDKWQKRKAPTVFGYSLSAISKPFLAAATAPWHVLGVRFLDRAGKGVREAPRDALISFSAPKATLGRAFGFHRALDTLGAAFGPLVAFAILPLINQNLRLLFIFSFVASFFAVLVLIFFVKEVKNPESDKKLAPESPAPRPMVEDVKKVTKGAAAENQSTAKKRSYFFALGAPFFVFLAVATVASLGRASDAFLILKAREVGVAIVLIPILYFVFNITHAFLSTPLGDIADRVGKRNTFVCGLFVFSLVYFSFAFVEGQPAVWFLFIAYGLYAALTEGVGRAIVAGLVAADHRATAFGVYNAFTGLALLPASVIFGYLNQHFSSRLAFSYGATLALAAGLLFLVFARMLSYRESSVS